MRIRSWGAVWCVAAAGIGASLVSAPAAGAATTTTPVAVACTGVNNDVAGYLSGAPKTSKEILTLALSVAQLSAIPPFPATVTTDAPARVPVKSGDQEVTFTYKVGVPPELAALARDKLGLQNLVVQKLTAGVAVSGPVTASVSDVAPDTTLDLGDSSSVVTVSMKVKVGTDASGRIFYRPTPMTLQLNFGGLSVGGGLATINTATLECDVQGVIASTAVQVKGTPITPAVVDGGIVQGGDTAQIPLKGRSDFLPEDDNPILWESLRIVQGAGGASIVGGALVQPTAAEGGSYENQVELCGAPRVTPDTPGVNEIQTMTFPSNYAVQPGQELFNPHPLGMRLSFDGQETAEIPLTTLAGTGLEYFGQFKAPDPKDIQKALVALPNIDAGDISVAREDDGTYTFTFTGKLGASDQPSLELSGWRTQLDYSAYENIQKAIGGLAGGGGTGGGTTDPPGPVDPTATDLTLEQLGAEFDAGRITSDEYFAKFGSALKNSVIAGLKPQIPQILDALTHLFPQPPDRVFKTKRVGEKLIPGESTGPLCTTFLVKTVATPKKPDVIDQGKRVVPPCKVTGRTVKQRIAVRRTVAGRIRTTYRTVKVIRTVRSGGCPQALVFKGGKLTISNLPVLGSRAKTPKKVTITVTGAGGKAKATFTVSPTTAAASGAVTLPAGLAKANRLTVKIGGPGVSSQTRTVMPS